MAELNKEAIGRRIRQLRDSLGLTQTEFARKASLSQAAISQFEEGNRLPSMQAVEKIASALHVPLTAILADPGQSDAEKEEAIRALTENLRDLPEDSILAMNRLVSEFKSAMAKPQPKEGKGK